MPEPIGPVLIIIVILLAHVQFVDQWFSDKGNLKWFWGQKKPTRLVLFSRLCFIIAIIAGFSMLARESLVVGGTIASISLMLHLVTIAIISNLDLNS
jgi:hypothetical protein